ncbi:VWA domain-containing protein [Patescibacteria group bacterium]|nr:VWA domain-containing protein [Patescibacteria group bacterium]
MILVKNKNSRYFIYPVLVILILLIFVYCYIQIQLSQAAWLGTNYIIDSKLGTHALEFEGASNHYLTVENSDSINFSTTQSFTISLWFRTSMDELMAIIGKTNGGGGLLWGLYTTALGEVNFDIPTECDISSLDFYNDGTWHNIIAIRDADIQTCQLFVDNVLVDETSITSTNLSSTDYITIAQINGEDRYVGFLDDVRLYNKALTADERLRLFDPNLELTLWQYCYDGYQCTGGTFCDDSLNFPLADVCDPCTDPDLDQICSDGDFSEIAGDNPCKDHQTEECDDNCPEAFNPDQIDSNSNGMGDACDYCGADPLGDADGDTVCGSADNCPDVFNNNQADYDLDNIGDACDNCPNLSNITQNDSDSDSLGDICDNCPNDPNPGQENMDGDFEGDACDPCNSVVFNSGFNEGIYSASWFVTSPGASSDLTLPWCSGFEWLEMFIETDVEEQDLAVVFVTDTSGSMGTNTVPDCGIGDSNPDTRMVCAIQAVSNSIVDIFNSDGSSLIGVVEFNSGVISDSGILLSAAFENDLLNNSTYGVNNYSATGSTYTYQALERADAMLNDPSLINHRKVIVLLSDGEPTNDYDPIWDTGTPNLIQQIIENNNIEIFTIAVTTYTDMHERMCDWSSDSNYMYHSSITDSDNPDAEDLIDPNECLSPSNDYAYAGADIALFYAEIIAGITASVDLNISICDSTTITNDGWHNIYCGDILCTEDAATVIPVDVDIIGGSGSVTLSYPQFHVCQAGGCYDPDGDVYGIGDSCSVYPDSCPFLLNGQVDSNFNGWGDACEVGVVACVPDGCNNNCPADCVALDDPDCSGTGCCGDDTCDIGEDSNNCMQDCPIIITRSSTDPNHTNTTMPAGSLLGTFPAGDYRIEYYQSAHTFNTSVGAWNTEVTVSYNDGTASIEVGDRTDQATKAIAEAAGAASPPVNFTHTGGDVYVWINDFPLTDNFDATLVALYSQ